ncbi:MAG: hypothetical protein SPJ27_09190 [Candidatus Onthovivens sp.]|nr:hypothetical protein [Candidatus Onthovivens sp.]
MEIRKYGNKKILIADENKQIRDINDTYTPATETEEEHKPYYTSVIFLADNFDDSKLNELYVEEEMKEVE